MLDKILKVTSLYPVNKTLSYDQAGFRYDVTYVTALWRIQVMINRQKNNNKHKTTRRDDTEFQTVESAMTKQFLTYFQVN